MCYSLETSWPGALQASLGKPLIKRGPLLARGGATRRTRDGVARLHTTPTATPNNDIDDQSPDAVLTSGRRRRQPKKAASPASDQSGDEAMDVTSPAPREAGGRSARKSRSRATPQANLSEAIATDDTTDDVLLANDDALATATTDDADDADLNVETPQRRGRPKADKMGKTVERSGKKNKGRPTRSSKTSTGNESVAQAKEADAALNEDLSDNKVSADDSMEARDAAAAGDATATRAAQSAVGDQPSPTAAPPAKPSLENIVSQLRKQRSHSTSASPAADVRRAKPDTSS